MDKKVIKTVIVAALLGAYPVILAGGDWKLAFAGAVLNVGHALRKLFQLPPDVVQVDPESLGK